MTLRLNGRRLLRAELELRYRLVPYVGPQYPPMPEGWKSGLRCRQLLQPHAFREAGQEAEYRRLRNEWKRKRRARR